MGMSAYLNHHNQKAIMHHVCLLFVGHCVMC